jgi:hypothetical protein
LDVLFCEPMDVNAVFDSLRNELRLCIPETRLEVTPHDLPCGCKLTVTEGGGIDQVICATHHAETIRHLFDRQRP